MTQRVNIQYTIDVEELASEVKRLYKKTNSLLTNTSLIEYSDAGLLSSGALTHIHEVRLQLSKIDAGLADVQAIVSSYVEHEMDKHSPEQTPCVTTSGPATLDDLHQDLASLSEQLEQSRSYEEPPQRPS